MCLGLAHLRGRQKGCWNENLALVGRTVHVSYEAVLRGKIKTYEFRDRELHTKAMVIDNDWSMIGSSNFDCRSL